MPHSNGLRRVSVVDSHTGGEPTRVVTEGGPDLGVGTVAERLERFSAHHDAFRSAVVNEPRGSDVIVGALLCEPWDRSCAAGVIFFNNVGFLGMCGHGTIGLMVTLAHLGRIRPGVHALETPVGKILATLHEDGAVTVANVPSYRLKAGVAVTTESYGAFTGDVAWGGNWFYLVHRHSLEFSRRNIEQLGDCAWQIRQALRRQGIAGADGHEIDHIELYGPPTVPGANSRSFVLCPGRAYDRSPCGTGTSAKLACLAADGKLREGEVWRQESIVGSVFESWYRADGDRVLPSIKGTAFVNSEATLVLDPRDPFEMGIRP